MLNGTVSLILNESQIWWDVQELNLPACNG